MIVDSSLQQINDGQLSFAYSPLPTATNNSATTFLTLTLTPQSRRASSNSKICPFGSGNKLLPVTVGKKVRRVCITVTGYYCGNSGTLVNTGQQLSDRGTSFGLYDRVNTATSGGFGFGAIDCSLPIDTTGSINLAGAGLLRIGTGASALQDASERLQWLATVLELQSCRELDAVELQRRKKSCCASL